MLQVMGEAALRILLLAVVVQCALWLLGVRQVRLLLAAWTVTMVASVAMPVLSQLVPLGIPIGPVVSEPLAGYAAGVLQRPATAMPGSREDLSEFQAHASAAAGSWLEAAYLVVACGLLLRVAIGLGLSFRLLARSVPVEREWAARHRVRISPDVTSPVTVAQVILLPIDAKEWPAETRQAVLAHEQAHVARWDFAMLMMSQLNRALFWFSPLPWWLHRRLVTLAEMASDDQAMTITCDRLGYAEILLEMARRSGPVPRGPAMARPSTLLRRVDRILLDQVGARRVNGPQQALLAAGVAGLSLGTASLTSGPVPSFPSAPATTVSGLGQDHPYRPTPPISGQDDVTGLPSPVPGTTPFAALGRQAVTTAPSLPASPPLMPDSSAGTAVQPMRRDTPVPRLALWATPRTPPVFPSSRMSGRAGAAVAGQAGPSEALVSRMSGTRDSAAPETARPSATASVDRPAGNQGSLPAADQIAHDMPLFQPGLQDIAGSTCAGTISTTVGTRASASVLNKPTILPGQPAAAQARFFQKEGGVLWVRFDAFGRPPLDLPVRSTRNGVAWTGEYGIAYSVQAAGGSRLAGLAAPVAADSARLDFACARRASRLL